jgi:transposase
MCIYVRNITNEEETRLKGILRRSDDAIKVKRAQIILASAQKRRVPEICHSFGFSRDYVCDVIHSFDKVGFQALESKYVNCGKKPKFTEDDRRKLIDTALTKPVDLGLPFTCWSLLKLKDHMMNQGSIQSISIETIRQILIENGIKYRHTKTWKESNDPEFESKKTEF